MIRSFLPLGGLLAFLVVVLPNSLRALSIPLFVVTATIATFASRKAHIQWPVMVAWSAGSVVTLLYCIVGVAKGAVAAFPQVLFVYILSPILWILIIHHALNLLGSQRLVRFLLILGFFGAVSVFAFYAIFFALGPDSLTWLIAEPNVQISEGSVGATMHVFGPLMFVSAGFIAAPGLARSSILRGLLALIFVTATVLSGRSALFLSLAIGVAGNVVVTLSVRSVEFGGLARAAMIALLPVIGVVTLASQLEIDIVALASGLLEKFSEGGGDERAMQWSALIQGISDTSMLGAGHGIGTVVVRDETFPWRYELLWLATLYRVGIVGTVIYALPVVYLAWVYWGELRRHEDHHVSHFIFFGFVAALVGAATNPYFESFDFQWMIVLPLVYFSCIHHGRRVHARRLAELRTVVEEQ